MRFPPITALILAALPLFIAAAGAEVWAKVKVVGSPLFEGPLVVEEGALFVASEAGEKHAIDIEGLKLIEAKLPRLAYDAEKIPSGELTDPWKQVTIGELPHGGRAEVKSGRVIVETSSPDSASMFDAFHMAYRPMPEGDAIVTTRIDRIDSYEDTTRGGIVLCDGITPESKRVFVSLSHREGAAMRVWSGEEEGERTQYRRSNIRPSHWLRIARVGGKISGYVSVDSGLWQEIASTDDTFEGTVYAGLASQGSKPRRRWSTTFDNIDVAPASVVGPVRVARTKISLADGTVFHGEVASASAKLFRLGGDNAGRVLPTASVSRIEFYHAIPHERRKLLAGDRTGLLLGNGDFFEAKLLSIDANKLTASSTLFGKREFDLHTEVDAVVFSDAPDSPPDSLPYLVETWTGGKLAGKSIRFEKDMIIIDTVRLRAQRIPFSDLRRVRTREPAS